MRKLITADPFVAEPDAYAFEASPWPARWVGPNDAPAAAPADLSAAAPRVWAFRLRFSLAASTQPLIHVTADERYELFVDGARVGRGPERGDLDHWSYETHALDLAAGDHVIVARVWRLGDLAPLAQMSHRAAFLLMGEHVAPSLLDTGVAAWEVAALGGYSFSPPEVPGFVAVGVRANVDGRRYPWGVERGDDAALPWRAAAVVGPATVTSAGREAVTPWKLRPATLPAPRDDARPAGRVRHVADADSFDALDAAPVRAADHRAADADAWQRMLDGQGPVVVPPRTTRRVVIDCVDYACAYASLVLSGGRDAVVRTLWAEGLYDDAKLKGDRDAIEGKRFVGMGSTFVADGGAGRTFAPLWWDAGRYVALDVRTADAPLTVDAFALRTTGYRHDYVATFAASDDRLAALAPPALRTLDACSHETFVDCPYYEQLAYVGDSRLDALVTYATTRDDRLPKRTIELFDASRDPDGWTQARYPSRRWQRIPPFSLWWVAMVHDHALWRGDAAFARARLPGVRAVVEAARRCVNDDGLFHCPPAWNFVDWVPAWPRGVPAGGRGDWGAKATVHWQAAIAFNLAAELEGSLGDAVLAERNHDAARRLAEAGDRAFWDDARGLYADDVDHTCWSEHAQCLATVSGLTDGDRAARSMASLLAAPAGTLAPASIYFSHYLFEALRLTGRVDALLGRLSFWHDLPARGLRTMVEAPEPARSDCHAWGAHPVFHFYATILGVRPTALGMDEVSVEPQLGTLDWARGAMPHPRGGDVRVDVRRAGGRLAGEVTLPSGVTGVLHANGAAVDIDSGRTTFG